MDLLKIERSGPGRLLLVARVAAIVGSFGLFSACLSILPAMAPGVDDVETDISAEFPYESRFIEVRGARMHYVEIGQGDPIVLVHGNPTSSYLWRNVIPYLKNSGRVIAVDLIGMGKSDKPDLEYTFADHARYFGDFMQAMRLRNATLVLHDWGGAIGTDYAMQNPRNVRAIVYMEAVLKPMEWESANMAEKYLFGRFRDPEDGHKINAEDNYFVEKLLPMMSGRELSKAEMDAYREPYPTVESRKPVAKWPMEIPIDGEPERNAERIGENYRKLQASKIPLLLLHADPGMIVKEDFLQELKGDLPRMDTRSVGGGLHYIQETQPTKIGTEIASWLEEQK